MDSIPTSPSSVVGPRTPDYERKEVPSRQGAFKLADLDAEVARHVPLAALASLATSAAWVRDPANRGVFFEDRAVCHLPGARYPEDVVLRVHRSREDPDRIFVTFSSSSTVVSRGRKPLPLDARAAAHQPSPRQFDNGPRVLLDQPKGLLLPSVHRFLRDWLREGGEELGQFDVFFVHDTFAEVQATSSSGRVELGVSFAPYC